MNRAFCGALMAIIALTGCGRKADPKICMSPPDLPLTMGAPQTADEQAAALMDCVHRWSYRLARSEEAVDTVADAVVAACIDPIARLVGFRSAAGKNPPPTGFISDDIMSTELQHARRQAVYRIVQARAGNCAHN